MFTKKNTSINRWAAIVALFFLFLFFVITGRFVYLVQAKEVDGHNLIHVAKNQWTEVKAVDSKRGEILDNEGNALAQDVSAFTVTAVLSHKADSYVKDKEKTAQELSPIINMSVTRIESLLNRNAYWVELGPGGRRISYTKRQQIEKLKLPGIVFQTESKRVYPDGQFAPYVVGFTTLDDKLGKQKGVLGIENSLNDKLSEQDGSVSFYRDDQGIKVPNSDKLIKKPKNGDDVYLTLHNTIQTVLEGAMSDVYKKYKPHSMVAVVADPKTGAILAMSSRPTFDPNQKNITNYKNDVIANPFEPGSVMKTFTLAAAINEGVWNSNATYKSGTYRVSPGTRPIGDWNKGWGTISFEQGFVRSSNVAFSMVEDKLLGPKRFYKYLQNFGFTKKTGIDLPGEDPSQINFKWHYDQVQNGFGQASAVTPIQIVQAATAIANNGKMMQPYVVQKVVDPDTGKTVQQHEPKQVGTPITQQTAEKVRSLMSKVITDQNGTGKGYAIKNYDIIGKTGTAQIAGGAKGYLTGKDNYVFSFLGMAPEKDPKLIMYVAVNRPHLLPTDLGSEPDEQIFKPVMSSALQYMKVQPSSGKIDEKAVAQQTITVGNWVGKSVSQAKAALEKQGLDVITTAVRGTVQKQSIDLGSKVFKGSKIILVGSGTPIMPDLTGWSLTDAIQLTKVLGIHPDVRGDGYVISQEPHKGVALKDKTAVKIQLKPIE